MALFNVYFIISVAAQKNGAHYTHPMGIDRQKTTNWGSMSVSLGKIKDAKGIPFNRNQMCMYTSARLTLIRKVDPSMWSASNMQSKRKYRACLNLIASFGATRLNLLFSSLQEKS